MFGRIYNEVRTALATCILQFSRSLLFLERRKRIEQKVSNKEKIMMT